MSNIIDFHNQQEKLSNKYSKQLWDTASKPALDTSEFDSKKVVQKADETTGDENSRNAKEIIPPEKKGEMQKELTLNRVGLE